MPTTIDLVDAIQDHRGVPCTGNPAWISDDRAERIKAADACLDCPLMLKCLAIAEREQPTAGVWGGKDYHRARWTANAPISNADREAIADALRRGDPVRVVARAYRISDTTVSRIQREAGIATRSPRISPQETLRMQELADQGLSYSKIADKLKVPQARVTWALSPARRRLPIRAANPHKADVVRLRQRGLTYPQIAKNLGITERQAAHAWRTWLKENTEKDVA